VRKPRHLLASAAAAAAVAAVASSPAAAGSSLPPIHHVWLVVLENENYDATFTSNPNPYLSKQLPALGNLLTQYYGIGHFSLDNYIAMASGQGPAIATQSDCAFYGDVVPGTASPTGQGQVIDSAPDGCVYPASVQTIAGQLEAARLTWKGYMEDLGNDVARDAATTCTRPATPPKRDKTQGAEAQDQYATRHDPFMYFHSVIDSPSCRTQVVNLASPSAGLLHDLADVATTPNLSFITPNLCNDGHDSTCAGTNVAGTHEGGLKGADLWLAKYVPRILGSPAYQQDGMLVVFADESGSDGSSCCNEQPGPNTVAAGGADGGTGGGRIGAVVLSPFVKPGSRSSTPYNHYSLLRSVEDILGISTGGSDGKGHLGFAGQAGLQPFGADVFTGWQGGSGAAAVAAPQGLPGLPNTSPGGAGAALPLVAAAGAVLLGRRRRR